MSSILAGGPAPYISQWLIANTGIAESPAFFVMLASGLSFVAALFGFKETAFKPLPGQKVTDASLAGGRNIRFDTSLAN